MEAARVPYHRPMGGADPLCRTDFPPCYTLETPARYASKPWDSWKPVRLKAELLFGNGFPIMKRSYLSASKSVALLAISAAATFSTACGSGPRGTTGEP